MKIIKNATLKNKDVMSLFNRDTAPSLEIEATVREILSEVKSGGLKKATEYAEKYDGIKGSIKVTPAALKKLSDQLDKPLQKK